MNPRTRQVIYGNAFLLVLISLNTGCIHKSDAGLPRIDPDRAIILLTPEQAAAREGADKTKLTDIPQTGTQTEVLQAPKLRAYRVGRYQDPADPSVLHESHVVYRKETDARWVLDGTARDTITLGPETSARLPGGTAFKKKELDVVLLDLARENQENRKALELLCKTVEALAKRVQGPDQKPGPDVGTKPPSNSGNPD